MIPRYDQSLPRRDVAHGIVCCRGTVQDFFRNQKVMGKGLVCDFGDSGAGRVLPVVIRIKDFAAVSIFSSDQDVMAISI